MSEDCCLVELKQLNCVLCYNFCFTEEDISTQELIDKLQRQVDKMEIKIRHKRSSSRDLEKLLESPKNNGSCTVVGRYAFNTEFW